MKKNLLGRVIGILLALVMAVGIVSLSALAVSAESSDVRTVYASNLYDDMQLGLSDDTVLVMDVDRRLSKILGEDCDLTIIGDKTLTVACDNKVAIDVRNLTVEANLIATSPTEYYFGSTISVTRDFSFTGESLWVGGANGIHSEDGNIEIYGRTTILCTQGAALHAESGSIIVDAPYIKCTVDENDIYSRSHCAVEASGSVKIASDEGIFVGVDAGIRAGAMVTLGGNISCEGNDYGIYSEYGSVCFDGEKLYAYGETGIYAGNNVTITATNGGVGGDINAIRTLEGNIELNGVNVIASAVENALLAEIGNITLNGTNHITSYGKSAIFAREGAITMTGSVTARGGDGYTAVCAENNIYFDGTKLDVAGDSGIKSLSGNIIIDADSTTVVTTVGAPIITTYYVFGDYIEVEGGSIYIDSDYLYLQNKMEGEYYSLAQWDGIMAGTSVTVYSKDATIMGQQVITHTAIQCIKSMALDPYAADRINAASQAGLMEMVSDLVAIGDGEYTSIDKWYLENSSVVEAVAEERFFAYLGESSEQENILDTIGVHGGKEGISFAGSFVEDDLLTLKITYTQDFILNAGDLASFERTLELKIKLFRYKQ